MEVTSGKLGNHSHAQSGDPASHVWRGTTGGDWKASFKGTPGEKAFFPLDAAFGGGRLNVFARLMQTQPADGKFGFVGADQRTDAGFPWTSIEGAQGKSAMLFKNPRIDTEGHPTACDLTHAKFIYVEIGADGKPMTLDLDIG